MFGYTKHLKEEIQILREQVQERDKTIMELIDKFVHNRVPQRLAEQRPERQKEFTVPAATDAYSIAMDDAERLVREKLESRQNDQETV